ncbi:GIY-YIG nuclease family protein [Aliikangiella sp. IMCC44653]
MSEQSSDWYIYIIICTNSYFYTGITTNLDRRFKEHLTGKRGAKYFNLNKPKELVFAQQVASRSEASKLEYRIKKLTRKEKIALINSPINRLNGRLV